jgi:hypothetical protein
MNNGTGVHTELVNWMPFVCVRMLMAKQLLVSLPSILNLVNSVKP